MIVSIIVAMDRRGGIGYRGQLPWRLSSDLKRFKDLTMGHNLIAGRKTYESIGRPLPGRQMIVISRNPHFQAEGCDVVHSLEKAVELAKSRGESETFVIGGSDIYEKALPLAGRIYLTEVDAEVDADRFFPGFNRSDWMVVESASFPSGEKDQYPSKYSKLVR